MKVKIKRCGKCGAYTLKDVCLECNGKTFMPVPPRFSLEDPYGKYRRMLRRELGFYIKR
jgi:H/ACA ribonucleoprotein complex subunit 3